MGADINRACEVHLCDRMRLALPDITFLPFTGFGLNEEPIEPPYVVILMGTAEKTLVQESTFLIPGTAQIISHIDETESEDHAQMVRDVYKVLGALSSTRESDFIFHGIDITNLSNSDYEGKGDSAHADVIHFTVGVSG
jgi:hypothetical protein